MGSREERDPLGRRKVPSGVLWGIQTLRAMENFPVSGLRNHEGILRAYAEIKLACAKANRDLGSLEESVAEAIIQATQEILEGKHWENFVVDRFQAGAGTSTNMNVNEVITNRALQLLGEDMGRYDIISPNDHVNMGQST
ncbi:aspartate ammonia-lyase, partial [Thermoplasmatales archaeon ex4484_36]